MKIAIITYSRIYNFGSVLQAYALNKYLTNQGFDVKTLNYAQTNQEESKNRLYEKPRSIMSVLRNIQMFIFRRKIIESHNRFISFSEKYIPQTKELRRDDLKSIEAEFDYLICGSDQIWNTLYYGFDNSYLLDFVNDKNKCISYAASIGNSFLSNENKELFSVLLKDYKDVLVREKTASELLFPCVGYLPQVVADPVLLLSYNDWKCLINERIIKEKYILCYFIGNIEGMRDYAKRIRKLTGYRTIVIRMNLRDCLDNNMKYYQCGPLDFINLIYYSDLVFTNSFHAIAFSVIFQKNFWAYTSKETKASSQSRIEDFLYLINLQNRMINCSTGDRDWLSNIDYTHINAILDDFICESKNLLMNDLNYVFGG